MQFFFFLVWIQAILNYVETILRISGEKHVWYHYGKKEVHTTLFVITLLSTSSAIFSTSEDLFVW